MTMMEAEDVQEGDLLSVGKSIYQGNCMSCHGANLEGYSFHGNAPSLMDLGMRMNEENAHEIVHDGRSSMPSFAFLSDVQIKGVISYILGKENQKIEEGLVDDGKNQHLPYSFAGYKRFVDGDGYPAIKPPWGTLNAIDLNKGELAWQVPLGEFEELTKKGIPKTGTENYGGPVVTAGGLIFIGATIDSYFRAFDKSTGEEIWKYKLPAAGMATPSIYEVNGKQYAVIAAGDGKNVKIRGDSYVAFALPD
jgi:quinoprotein glucose dehydrogenase